MKKLIMFVAFGLFLINSQSIAQSPDWQDILGKAQATTVFLTIQAKDKPTGALIETTATGFIVSNDGYIVTAAHIFAKWLEQDDDLPKKDKDRQFSAKIGSINASQDYKLELVAPAPHQLKAFIKDEINDFAILRIRGGGKFTPADFCGVRQLRPGTEILAVGFPAGQDFNHAAGTIANDDGQGGIWTINANIDVGMSGGPIFSRAGQVVGVVKGGLERESKVLKQGEPTDDAVDIPIGPVKFATQLMKAKIYLDGQGINVKSCEELSIRQNVTTQELLNISDPKRQGADIWEKISEISRKIGISDESLMYFVINVVKKEDSPASTLDKLIKHVEIDKELSELQGLDSDNPDIKDLLKQVQDTLKSADYGKADTLLERTEQIEVKAAAKADLVRKKKQLSAASQSAERGRVASLQRRYPEAANHYRVARSRLPDNSAEKANQYRDAEADALLSHGEATGEEGPVQRVIALYQDAIDNNASVAALERAIVHDKIGSALQLLGQKPNANQRQSTERLKQSVASFRAALKEITPEQAPVTWANFQEHLGGALRTLGERENNVKLIRDGAAAFRAGLKVTPREKNTVAWAWLQNGLCYTLAHVGRREKSTTPLFEAVAACRSALEGGDRAAEPFQWAVLQDSLGTALWYLGEQEGGTGRLKEARDAFMEALSGLSVLKNSRGEAIVNEHLGNVERLIRERTKRASR